MNCSQCGYANRVTAGGCARCGAPLGGVSPTPPPWVEDDRTVSRSTVPRDVGPASVQPEAPGVWPAFEAYPAEPDPVSAAPEQPGWGSAQGVGWAAGADQGWPVTSSPPPAVIGSGVQRPGATLGTRFAAYLLDGLVITGLLLALFLVGLVLGLLAAALGRLSYDLASVASLGLGVVINVAYLAVAIGYLIWGWANGQTVGKRAMKIAVVDADSGAPIGYSRAVIRYLMMFVMGLPCYLGYLSVLAADGRGWHDKAANSRVVVAPDWPAIKLPWTR